MLSRFGEVGLIDDTAFARAWVDSRHRGRGLSRQALRRELRDRGVDDEVVADAVDDVSDDDELAAARGLVRKRARSMQRLEPLVRKRRLLAHLARKGYGSAVAYAAIRAEEGEDADPGTDGCP